MTIASRSHTSSLSSGGGSTRVTINASRASASPSALELKTLSEEGWATLDGSAWERTPPRPKRTVASLRQTTTSSSSSFGSACRRPTSLQQQPHHFYPMKGQDEHDALDALLDLTTSHSHDHDIPIGLRYHVPTQILTTAKSASSPRHRSPMRSPPSSPAVSPKSVLENIERRSRRRKEILENSPVPIRHIHAPSPPRRREGSISSTEHLAPSLSSPNALKNEHHLHSPQQHHCNPSHPPRASNNISTMGGSNHYRRSTCASPIGSSAGSMDATTVTSTTLTSNNTTITQAHHHHQVAQATRKTAAVPASSPSSSSPKQKQQRQRFVVLPASTPPMPNVAPPSRAVGVQYWYDRWQTAVDRWGPNAPAVARAALQAGHAASNQGDYMSAAEAFDQAARIYKNHWTNTSSSPSVAYAAALHHQGTATSRSYTSDKETQMAALDLLQEAHDLRLDALGADHVDTVSTLNSMAWTHVYAQAAKRASELFWQVFWRRASIFGTAHPAVAVSAHDLAASFARLSRMDDAANFYSIALQIYDTHHVPPTNPAVARLLADMEALERDNPHPPSSPKPKSKTSAKRGDRGGGGDVTTLMTYSSSSVAQGERASVGDV